MESEQDARTTEKKQLGLLKAGLTPAVIIGSRSDTIKLKINISGQRFELKCSTLIKHSTTRLGKIATTKQNLIGKCFPTDGLYDHYDNITQEYYFERNPTCFPLVISYYISGVLHVPRHSCVELFQEEIEYWGIPFNPHTCCQGHHQQEWEIAETVRKTNKLFEDRGKRKFSAQSFSLGTEINLQPESRWTKWKNKAWDLFENHESSRAASVISIISSAMVIISTITLCANTHPDVYIRYPDGSKAENPKLAIIEIICISWFTLEYVARVVSCPERLKFLKSVLNAIDLLAILPFYIGIVMENLQGNVNESFTDVRRFVQVLRIFRIVRIFKVARHSTGLQVLGYTVRNSGSELGLLFMLLIMGMTLFSCLVYYAEEDVKNTKFESIIAAFWWAIITMTTVGYGDMHPTTTVGKIIGSMCCVSGILFIALPIPTIVSNFSAFYKDHLHKEKLNKLYSPGGVVDSSESIASSNILLAASNTSLYHANTLPMHRVSLTQLERHGQYRRKLSTFSGVAYGHPRVYPLAEE